MGVDLTEARGAGFGGSLGCLTTIALAFMVALVMIIRAYRNDLKESKEDLAELNNRYHEDYAKFTESLNHNTTAIELCVKLLDKTLDRIGD